MTNLAVLDVVVGTRDENNIYTTGINARITRILAGISLWNCDFFCRKEMQSCYNERVGRFCVDQRVVDYNMRMVVLFVMVIVLCRYTAQSC